MRSLGVVLILFSLIGSNAIAQVAAEFDGDVILGRPTDTTMSVSVMGFSEQAVYVEYGSGSGNYDLTMANTMVNMVAYNPDFIVDLGDTFMTSQNFGNGLFEIQNRQRGAPIRQEDMVGDYLLLRRHLSQSAFTVPLFLVLGNHDAERRSRLDGTPDNLGVWANNARKYYFPTPTANSFYTGSVTEYDHLGRHDGWYAWEWGDALFVGLDPFWEGGGGGSGPWGRTLGREQFDWLKETLESSDATFKFVFLHSLVGGYDSPFGGSRGGHIYAEYFEYVKTVEDCDVADCSYVADTYTIPAN